MTINELLEFNTWLLQQADNHPVFNYIIAKAEELQALKEEIKRLQHHEAWTVGLWATDVPEQFMIKPEFDNEMGSPSMFEITRTLSNKEVQ